MRSKKAAAIAYSIVTLIIVAFQLGLAIGMPWGAYAMGGAFPGQLPLPLRFAAVFQACILAGLAAVVLSRAEVAFARFHRASRRLIWVSVSVSALSLVLNLITPSGTERAIWAPVAFLMFICSTYVARSRTKAKTEALPE